MDKKSDDYYEDEDFWGSSAQKGFNFDSESDGLQVKNSKSSLPSNTKKKQEGLNQFDLFRSDGLTDIAENETVVEVLTSHLLNKEDELQAQEIAKCCNPLDIPFKGNVGIKLSADQTVQNLILGMDYNLKQFKARAEKHALLKAAVESHDGNAILIVIMFLKTTLKKSIFQREIGSFSDAVSMYLTYLNEEHEIDELSNMLLLLDKSEDAAMLKYDAAMLIQSPERKAELIQNCLNTHFQPGAVHSLLRESVLEHMQCLDGYGILQDHVVSSEDSEHSSVIFEKLTGKKHLNDSSAMCNLIFSLLNFYNVPKIAPISPVNISVHYKLSQKQYTWCSLRVLAAMQKWSDLEDLFLSKSWLRSAKMKSCIGFVRVLEILSKEKAPFEVMTKYIACLEDQELKLFYARKYKCHSVVIDIFKKNRDRLALIEYKESVSPHSLDFCNITAILSQPMNWKN